MYISAIENCPHFPSTKFIDYNALQYFSMKEVFTKNVNNEEENNPIMELVNLLFYNNTTFKKENPNNNELQTFENLFQKDIIDYNSNCSEEEHIYFLCLSCGEVFKSKIDINTHKEVLKHYIYINLTDISVWCFECINRQLEKNEKGTPINITQEQISLIKNHIQYLREKKYYKILIILSFFNYFYNLNKR